MDTRTIGRSGLEATAGLRCFTRALKNARYLKQVAPKLFDKGPSAEGFGTGISLDILNRLQRTNPNDPALARYPNLAKFLTTSRLPPIIRAAARDALFSGTIYFAQVTFQTSGGNIVFPTADMNRIIQYAQHAIVPISEYARQYGANSLSVAATPLTYTANVPSASFTDADLQGWVNDMVGLNSLPSTSCIYVISPQGLSAASVGGNAGYHGKANIPYIVAGVYAAGLTLQDVPDVYAMVISHEIAEMVVDPNIVNSDPEVCDPCDINCSNLTRAYFDASDNYLGTNQNTPPSGFSFSYYICAVVKVAGDTDCPAPAVDCDYSPLIQPVITWANPADIVYGTPLPAAACNATANAPGTLAYNPPCGTCPLAAGTQTLSVSFTPSDPTTFSPASATAQINVLKATPTVTWPAPGPIVYGTALDNTQYNATASANVCGATVSVPGSFVYNPPAGTCLPVGTQILSVTFIPTDALNLNPATATVPITVVKATPTITWPPPADIDAGDPLPLSAFPGLPTAMVCGTLETVPGAYTFAPAPGTPLPAGIQILTAFFLPADTVNFNPVTATNQIHVLTGYPIVISCSFDPTTFQQGERTEVNVLVKNDSIRPHGTQGPLPGFEYSEGDTFETKGFPSVAGAFRVAVDLDMTPYPYKIHHLYRWGFGHDLAPGESVTVNGYIRFHNSRENGPYYVGMIQEVDSVLLDHQCTTLITVERP